MLRTFTPLTAIMFSMGILLLGNGLFGTLVALRMTIEDFSTASIGIVVACHSVGFAAGCLTGVRIIATVGHIRAFAAFAAVMAASTLSLPLLVEPLPWVLLRLAFGFSSAGVFMVGESWLTSTASRDGRGKVLGLYMILNKGAFGVGQLLLLVGDPAGDRLFMLTAILYTLCLIPVAVVPAGAPAHLGEERLSLAALHRLSPLGVVGAATAGFVNSSLIGLGPVFAVGVGMSVAEVSLFMTAFLAGSLAMQYPIGRLSDRLDRRTVLLGVAILTSASCAATALAEQAGFPMLLMMSVVVGGFSATVYPIALTHANDYARPSQTVSLLAGLLLAFSIGASTGPVIAALAMDVFGPGGLFGYAAVVNALLALFTAWRMTRRSAVPQDMQGDFVAVPQATTTTPAVSGLDPRTPAERSQGRQQPVS